MLHYFVNTNGPVPVSFLDSNFKGLKNRRFFSAYPRKALQELTAALCSRAQEEELELELIHNPLSTALQGVIFPQLSAGFFGFEPWDPLLPSFLGAIGNIPAAYEGHIKTARGYFREARDFHNKQEEIYLANMDFSIADSVKDETIEKLLSPYPIKDGGIEIHRYFGAATGEGNLDYIPELTTKISERYFIKGRPGTGKSTLLKSFAAAAVSRGFKTEIYHCSLEPNSLDMVVVRDIGLCILDSTAPHEYFPVREGDHIIDMYAMCVKPGTDQRYEEELAGLNTGYKSLVLRAVQELKAAQLCAGELEAALTPINSTVLEESKADLLKSIFG